MHAPTALALILTTTAPASTPKDELAPLAWKGEEYEATELPESLVPSAAEAYRGWAAWAGSSGYQLTLSEDQRVLLVQHEKRKAKKQMEMEGN